MRGFLANLRKSSTRARSTTALNPPARSCRRVLSWALVGLGLTGVGIESGCSRGQYRKEADEQAACLIQEKKNDPRWDIPDYSVYGDPR